ncbi:hypothetical protein BZG36_05082 [Bifiguratus adelaidae]|uniref:alanine--glyoxylate transaminase n=1 Tax=Bifiguratus adelaidae TaxID=1938954 RepID=A0A261XUY2_9FUNG|nr:hypothetical protein BZG36_05082 [Bifiguratus adelaidae]
MHRRLAGGLSRTLCSSVGKRLFSTRTPLAKHKLCMIPGPIEFHEDVLAAMSTPATSHVDPDFLPVFGEAIEMTREVVRTDKGQPFLVAGSGTLGWDMMSNVLEEGDSTLMVNTGYFGDRFAESLETYGANVHHVKASIGSRPSTKDIEAALVEHKGYKMVAITHVDTSTGVLNDIQALAQVIRQRSPESLIVVDGVCAVGSEELAFDDWGIDIVITASQKGLGVPPGLSVVVASQRALDVFKKRSSRIRNYYGNWNKWLPVMEAYEARSALYFATPPVQLLYALNVSLKQILANGPTGLSERIDAHRKASGQVKAAVQGLGLKLVPTSLEGAANGMTAVYTPPSIKTPDLIEAMAKKGVQIAGGLPIKAEPYFRIGHMGISVVEPERKHIQHVIESLHSSLNELNYRS